ncbi:MAG: replicative DNA helicase [Dehalococcoidia bacterium]|nr:replicative DNA helicase [Dehalococcoidia bacterium]
MAEEKLPPHNVEAEEAVVGSLLIDPDAIVKIVSFLNPEDFWEETHHLIYRACLSLYQREEAINQVTAANELARIGRLDQIGGTAYLSYLISIVPTSLHVEYYAQIVSNMAMMRRLIAASGQIAAIGYAADPDVDDSLNRAEDILFQLRMKQGSRDFVSIHDILRGYFDEKSQEDQTQEKEIIHTLMGFGGLDEILNGLQRSDLVVLAARPSLGKTSMALNIARNAALNQGAHVAIFSLEMSRESVVERILSCESGVDSTHIRFRRFFGQEEARVFQAGGALAELPIYIDDSPMVRIIDIRSKAQRLRSEKGIDLIIIDYLQLLQGDSKRENRVQEISNITRSLKLLARELNVPVLVVSQLSRAVEKRDSHVPQLSDLRESGSIEQDADIVIFIYRDEIYYTEEEWNRMHDIEREPYPRGLADIIVAKHRNGPIGQVKLRFVSKTARFSNLEQKAKV